MRYILDTNCFNDIIRQNLNFSIPPTVELICTSVQLTEIQQTPNPEIRRRLLGVFSGIAQTHHPATPFCLGVDGLGLDQAELSDDASLFEELLQKLQKIDEKKKRKWGINQLFQNQHRDIALALTAQKNNATLVTSDKGLHKVANDQRISTIFFKEFELLCYPV